MSKSLNTVGRLQVTEKHACLRLHIYFSYSPKAGLLLLIPLKSNITKIKVIILVIIKGKRNCKRQRSCRISVSQVNFKLDLLLCDCINLLNISPLDRTMDMSHLWAFYCVDFSHFCTHFLWLYTFLLFAIYLAGDHLYFIPAQLVWSTHNCVVHVQWQ